MREFWKGYRYKAATVITVLFVLFLAFFAPGSLLRSYRLHRDIGRMKKEQEQVRERSRADSMFIENLRDDEFLEKFARENFYMKREGEEIYLIEDEKKR